MNNPIALGKSLSRAKIKLLTRKDSVFLTTILFSLKHVWNTEILTARTNGINLEINPDFWGKLDDDIKLSLLAHETWHVAFNHVLPLPKGINSDKHNRAADYVINIMLKESGFKIPNNWLCESQYHGMTTMQVYNLLPDKETNPNALGSDINPATTPEEAEKIKQHIENTIVKAAKLAEMQGENIGIIPNDVKIALDKLVAPKLDWKTILQNFFDSFAQDDYSFKRPNKRFMPDYYLPSAFSESLGEIAVAVDTSGSVSEEEFKAFVSEVKYIQERLQPSQITLIDFDTSIKHVHKIGRDDDITALPFSGRGGTSLDCVFDYYGKAKPIALVVFSDLWCAEIEEDPGYPVIWVCVNNKSAHVNFGKLIHYNTAA